MIPGVPYQIIITDRNSHNAKERRKENTIGKVIGNGKLEDRRSWAGLRTGIILLLDTDLFIYLFIYNPVSVEVV